ncbi:High-affinity branched-chain amino acid transport system permease protein LivH [Sporomusa ovata DSM 2662]|uniref:Branched-chain amino acid transport system permease protein LivM (TC 3.A.1.4.1) n=1 Tax=Sporomusa ovata TaxID=2378 RepID=A0A0U1KU35_9FIRM|nr:branched-chain amino acid ABC transporter permease [Sporomusa ovata]EQB26860.1 high-affinity branched-chain amino acid transport system permease protein LivM [Sporomusa ovata DSM 2662]CQR70960.1 Branched-chain amino acid transport system permease protein LivM (TC 3.A.1.4.1) [Sporomusa ovata]
MSKVLSSAKKKFLFVAVLIGLAPMVLTNNYYLHIINLAGIYTLITLGLNLLFGYTGQVSMGQAGYFAIGTYVSALLMFNLQFSFWLTLPLVLITCAVGGAVIGIPAMKLSGPYLVLATVGFGEIIRLILLNWTPVTKGAAGLTGIPLPEFFGIKLSSEQDFYYLIMSFLLLGTYIAYRLAQSKIGRTFSAIREDELAAEAMGVPVNRYKIAAFIISAMYAGIAGALYGCFSGVASPDNFTFEDSVGFLCMSVIGGSWSISGAVIGAFMLTILSEALRAFQAYRLIIYGVILIFTVIYMPQGLAGLLQERKIRIVARLNTVKPSGRP